MAKENRLTRDRNKEKELRREAYESNKKDRRFEPDRMGTMYIKLMQMSDEEREKRLEEISARKDIIVKEIQGRLGNEALDAEKLPKLLDAENLAKRPDAETIAKLKEEGSILSKEQDRLENFAKVKDQLARIMHVRDKAVATKTNIVSKAKKDFEAAKEALEARKQREIEINEELKTCKDVSLESMTKMNELLAEKNKLGPIKEYESKVEKAEARLNEITSRKTKEDLVINKCNMAWRMLLAGKSWDEINLAAIADVEKRQAKANKDKQTEPEQGANPVQGNGQAQGTNPVQGQKRRKYKWRSKSTCTCRETKVV